MASSIEIILNAQAGNRRAEKMKAVLDRVLEGSGRTYGISIAAGNDLAALIQEKAASDCEVLVAGGGDGTISAAARAALRGGKVLGVLPLGTFNYFARNLGIPLELEAAARVIVGGQELEVSLLDLNGRPVLNNASIGILSAALLVRRKLYERWGRSQLNTYLSVLLTLLQAPPRLQVRLTTDRGEILRRTPMVMVCSNAYQMESFALAGKQCLNANKFAVYVARKGGRATIFRLGLRTLMRRLRPGVDYEVNCVSEMTIETLRRHHLRATLDGEVERMTSPLRFEMNPSRLLVLTPTQDL